MAKIPAIKPFNISEYAKMNKLNISKPITLSDESSIYLLSNANNLQCFNISKEGQILGAKCAGGSMQNLFDTMTGIITKLIKKG